MEGKIFIKEVMKLDENKYLLEIREIHGSRGYLIVSKKCIDRHYRDMLVKLCDESYKIYQNKQIKNFSKMLKNLVV